MRYAFVVGCPRSGTSWVRNILARHPLVYSGPESHLYPLLYGAIRASGDGPVQWKEALRVYDSYGDRPFGPKRWIDRDTLAQLLDSAANAPADPRDVADDVIAGVLAHWAAARRLPPEAVVVEKSPNHLFYAERILRRFSDARIIEVRRDGRDVCVSLERRAQRVDWPPNDRGDQIRLWVTALRFGLRMSSHADHVSRWHVIRYEDLVADPTAAVSRLFTFVGLEGDTALLSDIVARSDISQVKNAGDGEHVRAGRVGDWREYFTDADCELFQTLAGDVFAAAGYRY